MCETASNHGSKRFLASGSREAACKALRDGCFPAEQCGGDGKAQEIAAHSAVANARQPDDCGSRTVLMVAISLRMGKEVGQYLVDKGADLTATDSSGYSVLHWASMKDDTHWVTKALEAGVGIDQLTGGKETALMFACKYQSMEVFRLLMDRGADATIVEPVQGHTALSFAREVLDEADSEDERQRAREMIERLEKAT